MITCAYCGAIIENITKANYENKNKEIYCYRCSKKMEIVEEYVRYRWDKNEINTYLNYHLSAQKNLRPVFKKTIYLKGLTVDSNHGLFFLGKILTDDTLILSTQNMYEFRTTKELQSYDSTITYRGTHISDVDFGANILHYYFTLSMNYPKFSIFRHWYSDNVGHHNICKENNGRHYPQYINITRVMQLSRNNVNPSGPMSDAMRFLQTDYATYSEKKDENLNMDLLKQLYQNTVFSSLNNDEVVNTEQLQVFNRAMNFLAYDMKYDNRINNGFSC